MSWPERRTWIVPTLVLVALALRLAGVFDSALPFSFYPDEANNVEHSVNFYVPGSGFDLNPHWFNKPALGYYLNFFCFGLYYLFGHFISGDFASPADFAHVFLNQERTGFYIIVRFVQAIFGTLTVWVTYRIGKELLNRQLGYLSAFFMAIAPIHVEFSALGKNDVSAGFLGALGFLGCLNIARSGRRKDYVFTGIAIGLGWATKYVPICLAPTLIIAHLLRKKEQKERPQTWRLLALGFAAIGISGFLGSPYNFLDPTSYHDSIKTIIDGATGLFLGAGEASNYSMAYLARYAAWITAQNHVFTLPCTLLAILGIVFGLKAIGKNKALLLLSWVVVVYGVLITTNTQRVRPNHLVSIMPALSILAALGFSVVTQHLSRVTRKSVSTVTALLLSCLLLPVPGAPTYALVKHYRSLYTPHPQRQAFDWIQKNLSAGTTILNVSEVMTLIPSNERIEWLGNRIPFEIALANRSLATIQERRKSVMKEDLEQLDRAKAHWEQLLQWWTTQQKKLNLEKSAFQFSQRRRYDSLVLLSPWQTEQAQKIVSAGSGYNSLWDRIPLPQVGSQVVSLLDGVAKVECYRRAAFLDRSRLPKHIRLRLGVRPGAPVEFVVASDQSYDNYVKPEDGDRDPAVSRKKRRDFPEWAAFYDDLKAHYDYWEFTGDPTIDQPSIRIYDLKVRKNPGNAVRKDLDDV